MQLGLRIICSVCVHAHCHQCLMSSCAGMLDTIHLYTFYTYVHFVIDMLYVISNMKCHMFNVRMEACLYYWYYYYCIMHVTNTLSCCRMEHNMPMRFVLLELAAKMTHSQIFFYFDIDVLLLPIPISDASTSYSFFHSH